MKKIMQWTLLQLLHWAVLYGAFVLRLDGAMYVLKFWVWCGAPLSLVLLTDAVAAKAAAAPPTPVRTALSRVQSWA